MQIIDVFDQLIQRVDELILIMNTMILVSIVNLLFIMAIAKNTRPGIRTKGVSIWRKIYNRIRRPKLPKGDKKELKD